VEDALSRNETGHIVLNAPTESWLVELECNDPASGCVGFNSPASGFDFGEFWHPQVAFR
jgi:hypothetical protein